MKVRLLAKTEGLENTEYYGKSLDEITVGIARLSSSREINALFKSPEKLLRHCIINSHWSVFTTTTLVFEVVTSRAMGRELLRHWSLRPQELSQRYAEIAEIEPVELRKQSENNRQSSTDVIDDPFLQKVTEDTLNTQLETYKLLLDSGVARETARMILPEATQTTLIFNGTIREWITTLNQRLHKTAQKEVRLVAQEIRDELIKQCPIICEALYNFEDAEEVHILDRLVLEKFGVYQTIKKNNFEPLED